VSILLIPTVSAQGNDYSVTAEKAFEHANAQMIQFVATNTEGFGNWTEASIDSKPLELYDINGQKLYYEFSVYKSKILIGKIYIGADKTLGQSVRLVLFDPKPYNADEVMKKSIKIAKKEYPNGKILSTKMVVYAYPDVGAMTEVKDKITGEKHRIFVDAYTLDLVPDKPATKTEPGVWSMYEQASKTNIDENLKNWQNSDELTISIEQALTNKKININTSVTKENMKEIGSDKTITNTHEYELDVPIYLGDTRYYCQPASAQMLTKYYRGTKPSQDSIYSMMGGVAPQGIYNDQALVYYHASNGLNKPNADSIKDVSFSKAVNEINNNRPFMSGLTDHARVCRGYKTSGSSKYLRICDPAWRSIGRPYWEAIGSESDRIIMGS
jgi:hypothetical protein